MRLPGVQVRRPVLVRPVADVGFLGALSIPSDFFWVSRDPVPIAGMAYPSRADWSLLAELGFGHVVCLTHDDPPYDPSPLGLSAVALDDLYHGRPPSDPEAERERVLDAAAAAAGAVRRGEGVVVHCRGGRGRAGSVLGSALVMLGLDADAVVAWLDLLHRRRGKAGWPESPWQAEVVRSLDPKEPAGSA